MAGFRPANVVYDIEALVTDLDPALVQFRQQFASGNIRLLVNTGSNPCLFINEREWLFAAARFRLTPAATAATTRSRRSREYGAAIWAGLLSSSHLES
jgi:hypothetical protein